MNKNLFQLIVNDYLDLYLYAKSLGDQEWQEDIKNSLIQLSMERSRPAQPEQLFQRYQVLNEELKMYYKKLHEPLPDPDLFEKLWELKKEQVEISRKLKTNFGPLS